MDRSIVLEKLDTNEMVESPVDAVVLSLGVRPNNTIASEMKANFANVKMIGDVNAPRKIAQAMSEGYAEAFNLEVRELATV
jgi:hypothetical protein